MESAYELLIKKIDQFIRKYYINRMLRGALLWTGLVFSAFLVLTLTEFRAYLPPGVKFPLVALFAALAIISAALLIGRPLLGYLRLGKRISHEQAASIIGDHFPNVQDKLLNILQLKGRAAETGSRELVEASIQQKSEEIRLVPFTGAIDLRLNRRYLKYALPPLLILFALFLGSPDIIRESTMRLSNPSQHFEKEAPFQFVVDAPERVIQYAPVDISVSIVGKTLPAELHLIKDGKLYKMEAEQRDRFAYRLPDVAESFEFLVEAGGFRSKPYRVDIIPKPTLLDARVELHYPAYTGMSPEIIRNVGEMTVPAGTRATWKFNARNTDAISVISGDESVELDGSKGYFEYEQRLLRGTEIDFFLSNEELDRADSVTYYVNLVADRYPEITARLITDSTDNSYMYFVGEYSDDYGISDLRFHYAVKRAATQAADSAGSERLSFERNATLGRFSHYTNAALFHLAPGDALEVFFEVADNDAVFGAKTARSRVFSYKKPTVREFKEQESENNKAIKDELSEALKKVEEFSREVQEIKEQQLDKNSVSWEDRKKLEDLLKKHQDLTRSLEKMQENFEENRKNQEEFKNVDEEILEKQEKIEEMMEELLTDEMKEMMDELQRLMEEMNMDEMFEGLEDFEMSNEELDNQLDRMLELFKKLEFEQQMQELIHDLEQLAEEQDQLSKESEQEGANSEDLLEKQEQINEKFDELQQDLSELNELNQEQKSPADMGDMDEKAGEAEQEMQEGTEQLQQNQPQKAAPKQKNAGEKMKEMAEQMSGMMSNMAMTQATEDYEDLRQLLENLVKFSFDEEKLFEEVKQTETNQPAYKELVQQQYKLKDDAAMIEDSLIALSKRVFQLESFITDELHDLNRELEQSIDHLAERRKGPAVTSQQYVMTSANNLALMLSEALEQMQKAMAQSMPGNQQCQKPGGKGSLPSMQQLQQQLNQDMQQMKNAMEQGKMPGGQQMSKEFARMAAQQAALREALRKMKENMSQGQKEGGKIDDLLQKMDETETDLLNKRLTEQTLQRQEEIITNLLKMETAEREQEKEERRESTTADQTEPRLPPEVEEYLRERRSTVETYRTVPPALTPFYKKIVEKYFKSVN